MAREIAVCKSQFDVIVCCSGPLELHLLGPTCLFQFLIEAVILCLVGGAMGILAGFGIGAGLAKIISSFIGGTDWPATISIGSIIMAVGVSSFIGVLFGSYPARKAAGLQPVEALKYE